jgi:hypothetical protein
LPVKNGNDFRSRTAKFAYIRRHSSIILNIINSDIRSAFKKARKGSKKAHDHPTVSPRQANTIHEPHP